MPKVESSKKIQRNLPWMQRPEPGCSNSTANRTTFCISHPLLGNLEEAILKCRFAPAGQIEGYSANIAVIDDSSSIPTEHIILPAEVTHFQIPEQTKLSPLLGSVSLENMNEKGFRIPKKGAIEVSLIKPNKAIFRKFTVKYDLTQMPPSHCTFIRRRLYIVRKSSSPLLPKQLSWIEKKMPHYSIHLSFKSSAAGDVYVSKEIKMFFSERCLQPIPLGQCNQYNILAFNKAPKFPTYSPCV